MIFLQKFVIHPLRFLRDRFLRDSLALIGRYFFIQSDYIRASFPTLTYLLKNGQEKGEKFDRKSDTFLNSKRLSLRNLSLRI